jgi:hypothetical protein
METEPMAGERKFTALFDVKSMRPACVLLQALYGGDRAVCMYFKGWELAPTSHMKMITGTENEWKRAAELSLKNK